MNLPYKNRVKLSPTILKNYIYKYNYIYFMVVVVVGGVKDVEKWVKDYKTAPLGLFKSC